jgi:argininosuccinate lyase
VVLWSTSEFGFLTLGDAFSTSSSMMPQKKNPDVAELARGKAARAIGSLTALLVLEKGLAFGYGRDLQEDKQPIFEAFDGAVISLDAMAGAIATATFRRETLRAALSRGHLCATDVADFLAARGVPFREAHHVVGALVREADTRSIELAALPEDVFRAAHPLLTFPELKSALDPEAAVERRALIGGPAKARVLAAIARARAAH